MRERTDGIDNDGRIGIDFDGGASANGGVPLSIKDPQCTKPWRTTELPSGGCGFGAEVAFCLGILHLARRRSAGRASR